MARHKAVYIVNPLLFYIIINDAINEIENEMGSSLFADDMAVCKCGKNDILYDI